MLIEKKLFYQRLPFIFVTVLVVSLFIGGARPEAANLFDVPYDKVAHAITYSIITLLLWLSLTKNKILSSIVIATLIAISDEMYQLFLPGREADFIDLMTDLGAIGATCLLLFWFSRKSEHTLP